MDAGHDRGSGPDRQVSLPAERSFVVQFRAGSGADRDGSWAGRVEHVVSGRAARFEDCASLRAFITHTLAEGDRAPQAPEQPGSGVCAPAGGIGGRGET
jgi:hypothetical protein